MKYLVIPATALLLAGMAATSGASAAPASLASHAVKSAAQESGTYVEHANSRRHRHHHRQHHRRHHHRGH